MSTHSLNTFFAALIFMLPLLSQPLAAQDTTALPATGAQMEDRTIYAGTGKAGKPIYTTPADAPTRSNWENAMKYCDSLDALSHQDWRLPAKEELALLYANKNEGVLKDTFNKTDNSLLSYYWSSTPDTSSFNTLPELSVRCVRSGS